MGWPKGVPRGDEKKQRNHRKALDAHPIVDLRKFDIVITLEHLHDGPFAGLWQLGRLHSNGQLEVLTDANSKAQCLQMAIHEIQRAGVDHASTIPVGLTD
jgi:hypothetical protein